MNKKSRMIFATLLVVVIVAFSTVAFAAAATPRRDFTETPVTAQMSNEYVVVTLKDPPAASYTGGIPGLEPTKPGRGEKLNPANPAVQAYVDHLSESHRNYRSFLARNAPQVQILREYFYVANGLAIKLNGVSPQTLSRGPGVRAVTFSTLYSPVMDVSPALINAPALWSLLGGSSNAGQGIKIAIIDTGVDTTNSFLSAAGYPAASQTDACSPFTKPGPNTNNKVVVCRVYASGLDQSVAFPPQLMVFDHGTHVAGTAAGNSGTSGTVAGTPVVITGMSGIAPRALIGDYNVFPGFGVGFFIFGGSAFSHDIAAALEDAVADGMDVANMSLGGGVQGPHDFLAEAVNSAVDAGMVVAVAAGNEGPGDSTVSSPGSAEKALTAGATTNPHFVGIPVTVGASTFGAALGDFNNFGVVTAQYTVTSPANGCTTISTNLAGKIALIVRGACTFTTKIRNAQNAGAIGVLVRNNVAGDPVAMGHDGTSPFPTIPAAMVSRSDGFAMGSSGTVSIDGTSPQEFITTNSDIIAGFSSRGPAPFTFIIKPDVTAPGVNVVSSVFGGEFAFFQGTSMATPHVAGAAGLLVQQHPDWSPDQIKSALVNTAKRPVFSHITGTTAVGVLARGGGRIDLDAASSTPLTIVPASASFGKFTGNKFVSGNIDLEVVNVSGSAQTCSVSTTGLNIVTVSTNSISLNPGGTTTLTLTLNAGKADQTGSGDYSGDVVVACPGPKTLQAPWFVRVDREAVPSSPPAVIGGVNTSSQTDIASSAFNFDNAIAGLVTFLSYYVIAAAVASRYVQPVLTRVGLGKRDSMPFTQ